MANFKYLMDHDVRHLCSCFPPKQTLQLEDVGLEPAAIDQEIIAVASERRCVIVTNNRRHFERHVPGHIAESSKKPFGCRQVHGLIIVLPSDKLVQERAVTRASKQLALKGKSLTWRDVNGLCLKVVIQATGKATVTKLPRCPYCGFDDD
jgi:hypothetical protein